MNVFIYVLKCPITEEIRYIGKTKNIQNRFRQHVLSKEKNHRGCWIRSLAEGCWEPTLEILDETAEEFSGPLEAAYIQFFKEMGCELINGTDGGESPPSHLGMRGKKCSSDIRAKISAAHMNKRHSPETRAKISVALLGKKLSPEHCAKLSTALTGRKFSPEHCANLREAKALRGAS